MPFKPMKINDFRKVGDDFLIILESDTGDLVKYGSDFNEI